MKTIIDKQTKFFNTNETKNIEFRINQLKKLKNTININQNKISTALYKDLKKNKFESYTTEIGICLDEISNTIKNLKNWTKPQKVKSTYLFPLSKNYIITEPLGKILIISPWNYPFNLTIMPLIGAIAAGNTAILKPSELSPNTSKIIQEIISENFNENYIKVIIGGKKETRKLLKQKFDHIFYTGGKNVGKIILQNATENLTPTTLELGGKSPCIIDSEIDIEKTAKRITFGKFINAGQTCVAPDYLLVNSQIKIKLIKKVIENIEKFYTNNSEKSDDYGKIININHFKRLIKYLENQNIIYGGKNEQKSLHIEPTLIEIKTNKQKLSNIMHEEIFGPILPIIEYKDIQETINYINSKPKPLAIYIFSENEYLQNKIINKTSSGSVCINDTIIQIANPELPFGGVGNSGFGKYHGKYSIELFSNKKSILKNSTMFEIPKRYPPYDKFSLTLIKKIFN